MIGALVILVFLGWHWQLRIILREGAKKVD